MGGWVRARGIKNTSRCSACVGRGEIGGEDKQIPAPLNWFPHTTTSCVEPVVVLVEVEVLAEAQVVVVVVVVMIVAVVTHSRGYLVH